MKQIKRLRKKPIGLLVVISAPSGAGKTTIAQKVLKDVPNVIRAVTVTSRPKRAGEINGKDYHFVSQVKFMKLIQNNYFIEYAEVHGNLYGTPRKWLENNIRQGKIVLLVIDVQGAEYIRKIYSDAVTVFLLPPSLKELCKRLKKRNTESNQSLTVRIHNAMIEYGFMYNYDYAVINDRVEWAVKKIKGILVAEQCRVNRWIKPNR